MHWLEVIGQLHAPAVFYPLGCGPRTSLDSVEKGKPLAPSRNLTPALQIKITILKKDTVYISQARSTKGIINE
jgi:hypothetical protein